jgi:hypothetical protein
MLRDRDLFLRLFCFSFECLQLLVVVSLHADILHLGAGIILMIYIIWSISFIICVAWITSDFKVNALGVQGTGHWAIDYLAESHVCLAAALRMEVSPTARAPYLLRASLPVIDHTAMWLATLVILFEVFLKLILPHHLAT